MGSSCWSWLDCGGRGGANEARTARTAPKSLEPGGAGYRPGCPLVGPGLLPARPSAVRRRLRSVENASPGERSSQEIAVNFAKRPPAAGGVVAGASVQAVNLWLVDSVDRVGVPRVGLV